MYRYLEATQDRQLDTPVSAKFKSKLGGSCKNILCEINFTKYVFTRTSSSLKNTNQGSSFLET